MIILYPSDEELDPDAIIDPYQFDMRVDSTPPAIAFSGYERGAFITSGTSNDQVVSVDGTFVDGISEIVGGTFDGSALTVSGDSTSTRLPKALPLDGGQMS